MSATRRGFLGALSGVAALLALPFKAKANERRDTGDVPRLVSLAFHEGEPGGRLQFSDGTAVQLSYSFRAFPTRLRGSEMISGVDVEDVDGKIGCRLEFGETRTHVMVNLLSIGELEPDDHYGNLVLLAKVSRFRRMMDSVDWTHIDAANDMMASLGML